MIVPAAEFNLTITEEAWERKRKEELERIESKFNNLLNFIAKQMHEAALNGKSSIKIDNAELTDKDWEDLEWYFKINHYNTWWWYDNLVVSWNVKEEEEK